MHFDLGHALISAGLIFLTFKGLEALGIIRKDESGKWNWKVFAAIFVVIFVFNLIWPAGT